MRNLEHIMGDEGEHLHAFAIPDDEASKGYADWINDKYPEQKPKQRKAKKPFPQPNLALEMPEQTALRQRQREELYSQVRQYYQFLSDLRYTNRESAYDLTALLQKHFEKFREGRVQDLTGMPFHKVQGTFGGVKKYAQELLAKYPDIVKSLPGYDPQVVELYVSDKTRRRVSRQR